MVHRGIQAILVAGICYTAAKLAVFLTPIPLVDTCVFNICMYLADGVVS